jgi:hypothetical protein
MSEPIDFKTIADIRNKLKVEISKDRTFIVVLAIHQNLTKNVYTRIQCRQGIPISGYVYDAQQQVYYIDCHDYIPLGYIPVSIYITMPGVGNWRQRVPMPETTIRRYLTSIQRNDLRNFKSTYRSNQFDIHFMQIIDCH